MQEFHIGPQEAGQRFDKYLKKLLPEASSGFIYRMLRKKNFTLNGGKAAGPEILNETDVVKLFLSEETFRKFAGTAKKSEEYEALRSVPAAAGTDFAPEIIYEDSDILIISKPVGMLSQKASPTDVSANEYILNYLIRTGALTKEQLQTFRPSVCNRLDRNTSGLLIAGKTLKGLQEMSAALKNRTVQKYYRCLASGEIKTAAHISGWLTKDPRTNRVTVHERTGRMTDAFDETEPTSHITDASDVTEPASHRKDAAIEAPSKSQAIETEYRPLAVGSGFTELEVHLITGRSHQIRAHLSAIGHPVIGDPKYGDPALNLKIKKELHVTSQLLHAYRLVFADGKAVEAPLPAEYEAVRAYLKLT